MKREHLVKHWDVMQAFKDGKKLKVRFGDSFIDDSNPSFGFYEEYIIVEEKEPTKRLPTIEEVEKWFLGNRVFAERCSFNDGKNPTLVRITTLKERSCELFIHNKWYTVEKFCNDFTHLDGYDLYITEN